MPVVPAHRGCTRVRRDASTVDAITRTIRACFIAVLALIAVIPIADASAQSAPASPVTFLVQGKGWGHGRGLGQWGSLGYALKGWKVDQILAHYYGGTTAGTIDPNSELRVRLLREDDIDVIVVSERGQLVSGAAPGTFTALRAQPQPGGGYLVQSGPGCAGPWTDVTTAPSVDFRTDPAALDSPDPAALLAVCEVGGVMRYYRGSLLAVRDANGASRAVNILPLDRYLRGVVPRESPAAWAGLGGGAGIEALKAQAVAARSYAWAESRYTYARTCDSLFCQVYSGAAVRPAGGAISLLEDARTDKAIAATAGQVRLDSKGAVARTEFSSSTGGYTAGGAFPAVPDEGDAVSMNPNVGWTASVGSDAALAAFPQLGALTGIEVVGRNGLGPFGGRVTKVALRGTKSTVTLSGNEFRSAFGLKSDVFQVADFGTSPAVGVANGKGDDYWLVTTTGGVFAFGGAPDRGSMFGVKLNASMVGITATADGQGYWLLAKDGGVFSFNAPFYGSTGNMRLNKPVVGLAVRPQGDGYWFVAADGGIFSFGAAPFFGSTGDRKVTAPIVAMSPSPSGGGYYVIGVDGAVHPFGDAKDFGSLPGSPSPIVGIGVRPQGDGYWLVAADGTVSAFGAAAAISGSGATPAAAAPVVGISVTASGQGYRLVRADGSTAGFGDAS